MTAQLVSVSITTDGAVAYSVLNADTFEDTTASGVNDTETATNDGNVAENFGIRSSDAASGGTDWNLAASTGADAFTHEFCTTTCDSSPVWTAFNVNNNTYTSLATSVAAAGTQDFDLRIKTPVTSSDTLEHTITVTVQATAS